MLSTTPYRGRFAPSPSGPLHMGSLLAATASYLDAKANGGQWLVRIEDIDPPREQAGASEHILTSLAAHDLHWDEDVWFQSHRSEAYNASLDFLKQTDQIYPCTCTRAMLAGQDGYPGTCREANDPVHEPYALRLKCQACEIRFFDGIQGQQITPISPKDDAILKRKDGLFAYQLAVVVDDAAQGITHVVRGIDLLDSTPRQIYLFERLNLNAPQYSHIPVVLDQFGNKLSKQNHAQALDDTNACANLLQCLAWLKQTPPPRAARHSNRTILDHAIGHWDINALKGMTSV